MRKGGAAQSNKKQKGIWPWVLMSPREARLTELTADPGHVPTHRRVRCGMNGRDGKTKSDDDTKRDDEDKNIKEQHATR